MYRLDSAKEKFSELEDMAIDSNRNYSKWTMDIQKTENRWIGPQWLMEQYQVV